VSYEGIHDWLGWPDSKQIFEPSGEGVRTFVDFAQKKIESALKHKHPGVTAKIGVLAPDPHSHGSEAPLALVCEFPRAASDEMLDLVHKLAWNLSRTALLVTLEPHRLIAWSCYQNPTLGDQRRVCELPQPGDFKPTGTSEQREVRDLLHWVNLITHQAQNEYPIKFQADGRADTLLLKNLRYVRGALLNLKLPQDHCHDLLARVIFTQFLFHRKDSDGNSFFSPAKMRRLHENGTLSNYHHDLASLLDSKTDTYALFRWMDERFNGDLFPGKDGDDEDARESAWLAEKSAVTKPHLGLLADLVRGTLNVEDRQQTLWPQYSFDTIPLEFISSVYEEFLTADERGNDKAYYTPSHLVDYVLDAVLPWNSDDWDIRILDPCCGSGIFLVKAFQRLIHRWRRAHPDKKEALVTDLRPILEKNLVGVDKNPEAVRVACFSLYLAMADAIEPKHYVTRENSKVFPRLRGTNLLARDFFDEETNGIRSDVDSGRFDLIIGNAPWGDGSSLPDKLKGEAKFDYRKRIKSLQKTPGQMWAKSNHWPIINNDIGPLFLGKAASLAKPTGFVAMVNTASLLYWRDGQADKLREKLFSSFTFDEVTNLSGIRRELFPEAIGPSCIVVFRPLQPDADRLFHYYTPKPSRTLKMARGKTSISKSFAIEPHDIAMVSHYRAQETPWIWSALALGGNRHLALIEKFSTLPSLEKLEIENQVVTRKGVIPGNRELHHPEEHGKPILLTPDFPPGVFIEMDASTLPPWDARTASSDSINFAAFSSPQLLIKLSYSAQHGRMRAVQVKKHPQYRETICQGAFVSCRDLTNDERHLRSALVAYNSNFAVCFFALTSTSFPLHTCKLTVRDLLKLPLPGKTEHTVMLSSYPDIDRVAQRSFNFNAADLALIEDFIEYTLPDAMRKVGVKARLQTQRADNEGVREPELTAFAKTFARVVKGTFGNEKAVAATVFTDPNGRRLPVRMVTIHLDNPDRTGVSHTEIEADGLLDKLAEFHAGQLKKKPREPSGAGLGFQRVAYFFQPTHHEGNRVMNLTMVKPDERRYWTRSAAMRDADQLAAAIAKASSFKTRIK